MAAWIASFQNQHNGVNVNYDPSGSGAGRTQFLAGGVLWAGTDNVLTDDEVAQSLAICGPEGSIDLPVYISAIAVAFNVPGVQELNLSSDNIARLFTGEITNWNDPAIAADNPGVDLPDLAVTPIHRSDSSGTTNNFMSWLNATAPVAFPHSASSTWPLEGGESAAGTSGVVNVVNSTPGAVTYSDLGAIGGLGRAAIQVGDHWEAPSAVGAARAVEVSPLLEGRHQYDLAVSLDRTTTEAGAYPLVLVSYIAVCLHYQNESDGQFVREFITYITSDSAQQMSAQVADSAPITATMRDQIHSSVAAITYGS
ncbi:MAG: phosphate ABC transporter substrate-binding protein PstS [Cellulomonadaceae bacterium]|nr:phosphate ABC transporter substrate-binding protein PstS [Cellulomonadaceae bacterium]